MGPKYATALELIRNGLETIPVSDSAEALKWWRPTATQTVAFASRIGWSLTDLNGSRQANNSPSTPKIPVCDGSVGSGAGSLVT